MNKLVTVLVIIVISLSIACGILFYQIVDMQTQNSDLQNQLSQLENQINELEDYLSRISSASKVHITGFSVTEWSLVGGRLAVSTANVTIQNSGNYDTEGLSLSVRHISFKNVTINVVPVGLLKSGEAKTVSAYVHWESMSEDEIVTFIATLMLDDIILDEHYYP